MVTTGTEGPGGLLIDAGAAGSAQVSVGVLEDEIMAVPASSSFRVSNAHESH